MLKLHIYHRINNELKQKSNSYYNIITFIKNKF